VCRRRNHLFGYFFLAFFYIDVLFMQLHVNICNSTCFATFLFHIWIKIQNTLLLPTIEMAHTIVLLSGFANHTVTLAFLASIAKNLRTTRI